MQNFTQELAGWLPFFTTLTMACATLAGLLFVALSLHASALRSEENINLRRLSTHTFGDFVTIMFVGLFFIAPWPVATFPAIGTLITVVIAFVYTGKEILELFRSRGSQQHRRYLVARLRLTVIGLLLLFIGALNLGLPYIHVIGGDSSLIFIFAGSVVLLVSAMKNTWYLLAHELHK